jgi:hypothetical protein
MDAYLWYKAFSHTTTMDRLQELQINSIADRIKNGA